MKSRAHPFADPRAEDVIARLHRAADRQQPALALRFAGQLPSLLLGRGIRFRGKSAAIFDDKFISIGPDQGRMLYMLARAVGARHVVEFGTSFGISTIYLACAVRDNGGGRVIGTELVASKVERARAHLEEAGVAEWVEIREGDARETLADLEQPVDLALIDGFPTLALEVLRVIEPNLRPGAVVLADDVNLFKRDLAPLIDYLGTPSNGYRSVVLPLDDGLLMAVKGGEADSDPGVG